MHAIDYSLILDIWHPTVLYFEDNAISEVGFDFEAAVSVLFVIFCATRSNLCRYLEGQLRP
jgi:hypothetical protein